MIFASAILSCGKKDSYDIKGDTKVKFFTNLESLGNAPKNSISYAVVNYPDAVGSGILNLSTTIPDAIKFPVLATRAVSENVEIGLELDNSLIAEYNTANNTNYKPFPSGFLNMVDLSVQIPAGASASTDSVTLTANLANITSLTEKAYLAPIKLKTVSNTAVGEITSNSTSQVTYIVVNVELRKIRYNATAATAVGTLISPRTSWAVTFTPAPATVSGGGSIIDGSNSSYSRFGTSPVQVDVNMQNTHNVTGIRLYTSNNQTHTPTQVEVYLSNDGINYELTGAPLRANLTYASSYHYILFYKAIPAKYVRLRLLYTTSTNSQNTRITELDVYAE
jgi:hypothetical protein